MKIRFHAGYNDRKKLEFYQEYDIVDSYDDIPSIGYKKNWDDEYEVSEVFDAGTQRDPCNSNNLYCLFDITWKNEDGETYVDHLAYKYEDDPEEIQDDPRD